MVNVVVLFSALEINLNLNLNSLGSNKYLQLVLELSGLQETFIGTSYFTYLV